jgi:hypothetical protein
MMRWDRWLAWCAAKQQRYERSRVLWRKLHPDADVKALEAAHGITGTPELSIEQLKAPELKFEGPGGSLGGERAPGQDDGGGQEEASGDALAP